MDSAGLEFFPVSGILLTRFLRVEFSWPDAQLIYSSRWSPLNVIVYVAEVMHFEVFTVTMMKMRVFWDVTPCRLVNNEHFGGGFHSQLQRSTGWRLSWRWRHYALANRQYVHILPIYMASYHGPRKCSSKELWRVYPISRFIHSLPTSYLLHGAESFVRIQPVLS